MTDWCRQLVLDGKTGYPARLHQSCQPQCTWDLEQIVDSPFHNQVEKRFTFPATVAQAVLRTLHLTSVRFCEHHSSIVDAMIKSLILVALGSTAIAQTTPDLISALNSTSYLSSLYGLLSQNQTFASQLANTPNVTVLAPTNNAIEAFLNSSGTQNLKQSTIQAILDYHVLNGSHGTFPVDTSEFFPTLLEPGNWANVAGGQRVEIRNSTVITGLKARSALTYGPAISFTNGVIHSIDQALTIPPSFTSTQLDFNLTAALGVLEILNATGVFDQGPDLTVFVPTNQAWSNIGSTIDSLSTKDLHKLVDYHTLNNSVLYSTDMRNLTSITMANGEGAILTVYNQSAIYINQAKIVIADILIANGVIHIIDNLINPANQTARPDPAVPSGAPAFAGATTGGIASYTDQAPTATTSVDTSSIEATATGTAAVGGSGGSSSNGAAVLACRPTAAVQAAFLAGIAAMML